MPFLQSGMVAMYGLPIICPPYDLHVKPHLIPLVLPLSQVLMNQHLRNNNNKLKKKLLLWTLTKLGLGFVPLTWTPRFPWFFFALFTNFLFISWCFYSIPKRFIQKWERGVQGEKKRKFLLVGQFYSTWWKDCSFHWCWHPVHTAPSLLSKDNLQHISLSPKVNRKTQTFQNIKPSKTKVPWFN